MISTLAPVTGIPPSLTIGSFALNVVSCTGIAPVSVRSTRMTCDGRLALRTECTTMLGCVRGTVIVPISHDASVRVPATISRAAARLKANRDTGRGENGELGDRLSRWRRFRVIENVQKHVLRVVRVHDAQVRRDRRSSNVI